MTTKAQNPGVRGTARDRIATAARDIAERDGTAVPARTRAAAPRAARAAPPRAAPPRAAPPRAAAPRTAAPRAAVQRPAPPPPTPAAPAAAMAAPAPPPPAPVATVPEQPSGWQPQGPGVSGGQAWQSAGPAPQPPPYAYGTQAPLAGSKADTALVLGIISIVANLFYVPGILAIIWGARERRENSKARAGFICGIIGTALSALWTLILIVAIAGAGNAVDNAVDDLNAAPGSPSSSGNTSASYNVGDTAETGDFQATVYGFENPQAPGSEYITAKPGWHFVSVDVQITNPDPTNQQSFSSMLGFHLLDDQNRQYDEDFMDAGLEPGPPEGEIAAGQSVRGFVAFEVPDGSTGLKLRVQGGLTAAGAVFNLQ